MDAPLPIRPLVEHRRRRLALWIKLLFDGQQVKFIADCAKREHFINQGELSGLLKKKSFGEKKARVLEAMAEMPPGWLDGEDPVPGHAEVASTPGGDDSARTLAAATTVALPSSINAMKSGQGRAIQWPFKLVSYRRLDMLLKSLGKERGPQLVSDLDKLFEAVVMKWEHEMDARANGTVR